MSENEKKKYSITINGIVYPILTDEPEEYVNKVEYYLNTRIRDSKSRSGMHLSDSTTLAMLAIGVTDELFKTQKQFNSMHADAERLVGEYDKVCQENKEYLEQIEALEAKVDELRQTVLLLQAKLQ